MTSAVAFVVADTGTSADVAAQAWCAEHGQLEAADRIAWVSYRDVPDESAAESVWQVAAAGLSRGELYGLGLTWASTTTCEIVAFTDSGTRLEPGWRRALEEA